MGNPFGNFVESYSTGGNVDQINERGDYALSAKQRIYGRYTHSHVLSLPDSPFSQICSDRCTEDTVAKQISLGDTFALSPKTILDLHLGYTRYVYLRTPLSEGIDLSQFGPNWAALTPQMTYTHIPQVCVSQTSGTAAGVTAVGALREPEAASALTTIPTAWSRCYPRLWASTLSNSAENIACSAITTTRATILPACSSSMPE